MNPITFDLAKEENRREFLRQATTVQGAVSLAAMLHVAPHTLRRRLMRHPDVLHQAALDVLIRATLVKRRILREYPHLYADQVAALWNALESDLGFWCVRFWRRLIGEARYHEEVAQVWELSREHRAEKRLRDAVFSVLRGEAVRKPNKQRKSK